MSTSRPSFVLRVGQDSVVLPARVAALLEANTNISELRVRARGVDPLVSAVLEDIRMVAMSWSGSGPPGTGADGPPEPATESKCEAESLTPSQAAGRVGVSDRAIRKAIHTGRLPAEKRDGTWQITRDDLRHFEASRAS